MKYYYSISEVAEKTNLKPYVLRYWEQEFKELRPRKTKRGRRVYTVKEIDLISLIKKLLYEEHYNIEGAREKIRDNTDKTPRNNNSILKEIEKELKEILSILK